MKGKPISEREYVSSSNARWALRLTKISLLILLLGVCVVGKRKSTWPVVSWALYSGYTARFRPPEPAVSVTELRVYTPTGELQIVKPEQILTLPRDSLSHNIVAHAFDDTDAGVRDESRRYLMRAVSNLLFVSAIYKVAFGGAWLSHADMMAYFFLNRNVEAAVYNLPLNWLAPYIAQTPLIYLSVHATTLLFEGFFFLSVINRKVRDLFVSLALIFHAVNALWVVVTVTPLLIGYGPFINWQSIRDFFLPQRASQPDVDRRSPRPLILLALFLATALGLFWHSDLGIRTWLNLNGLINWRTIWYPILPISIWWFVVTIIRFRQPVISRSL